LVDVKAAAQEKLAALLLLDKNLQPIAQTADGEPSPTDDAMPSAAAPPASVKDVHLTLAVNKGGSPSSVKIVLGVINQRLPQNLGNTILVAVCPATKDEYEEVSEMLGTHLEQVRQLVREGVVVDGVRRSVRLFLSGDYEALCTMHGHKGLSATMPCLNCLSTRSPSAANAALDSLVGTLHDVDTLRPSHPRSAAHMVRMVAAGAPAAEPGQRIADLSQMDHLSIVRRPLFTIDPRQNVPLPLHLLLGITLRLLRLAMELFISCRSGTDGKVFAYSLAETSRCAVRVSPAPYHGGVFIGRGCHTIAAASDVVCRTILGLVPERHHQAYKRLWILWGRLGWTMSRAALVEASEVRQFRANARAFVQLMKRGFPWVSVSPKLHIVLHHAPDFLERFGSIGLYGEQEVEFWHGFFNQNAAKYTAETEVGSCANLVRAVAVAREASDANLVRPTARKPAREGARRARKSGDKQKRENKTRGGEPQCVATVEKEIKEGRQWAEAVFKEGDRTLGTFLARVASQ